MIIRIIVDKRNTTIAFIFATCSLIFAYVNYHKLSLFGFTDESNGFLVYEYPDGRLQFYPHRITAIRNLKKMSPEDRAEFIQKAQNVHEVDCAKSQRFGLTVDGGWDLCLVGPFYPKKPCIAITFGINLLWEFDEAVAKDLHCEVHAFDPTVKAQEGLRKPNLWFYKIGVSDFQGKLTKVGPVNTLTNIVEMVTQSKNSVIDVIKMDIENSEYPALKKAIKDGVLKRVKQLMVEFHTLNLKPTLAEAESSQEVLKGLYDLGFRVWKYDWNIFNIRKSAYGTEKYRTTCNEVYMININFAHIGATYKPKDKL